MAGAQLKSMRDRASEQYGLIRIEQVEELGVERHQLRNEVDHGRLLRVSQGLYEVAGAPHTTGWEAMAVVLDTHRPAALSHVTATAWWGLPGRALRPWNVSRERGIKGESRSDVLVHEPRSLLERHVIKLRGVPVTTPARTVFDLAASRSPDATESALDAFWVLGLVDHPQLERMMDEVGGRGRAGTVLMRELIAARADTEFRPVESGLELRFAKLLKEAGIAPLDRQVHIADEGGWLGRVDFADTKRRLIVEVQSGRFHSALSDRRRDDFRRAAMEADGWTVIQVWDSDLWHYPESVINRIRAARANRPAA